MEGKGKNIFLILLFFCVMVGQSLVFATDFPSMPSIDSPSMPSMSGPSYRPPAPWRGQAPYMPSQQQPSPPAPEATDSAAKAPSDESTDATSPSVNPSPDGSFFTSSSSSSTKPKETAAGLALTAQSISGLGGLEALESLGGLGALTGLSGLGGFNGLDALKSLESLRDVKDEDDLQKYLSQLSGSSGLGTEALEKALKELEKKDTQEAKSGTSGAETQGRSTAGTSDVAATLEKILLQLEILAAQQKQAEKTDGGVGGAKEATTGSNAATTSSPKEAGSTTAESSLAPQEGREAENLSPSRILRFRANATDVLPTCTTVYFSQPDPAGVFLLTGDRVVNAGGKERNETFYFLFRPTLDESGSFIYEVEAQLMQDWPSDRSELHPLTASLPLTATRTGNLVALRHTTEGWHLDLLLDLREVHGE